MLYFGQLVIRGQLKMIFDIDQAGLGSNREFS